MWCPGSSQITIVKVFHVLDKLPKNIKQALVSFVCCMANIEIEAMNEGKRPGEKGYIEFNLKMPHHWKSYYTLVGADNSDLTKEELEKLQQNAKPFISGPLYHNQDQQKYEPDNLEYAFKNDKIFF